MKKPYEVSLTIRVLVLAGDRDEAREIGWDAVNDEISNYDERDVLVQKTQRLPEGWEDRSLVYHSGDEDITAAEALSNS